MSERIKRENDIVTPKGERIRVMELVLADVPRELWPTADGRFEVDD